jgi:hypothetical protein
MKLSETQMEAILSPVKAPPETFISSPVVAALAKAGNLGTPVATSFVLPQTYSDWKTCLNHNLRSRSFSPVRCYNVAQSIAWYNQRMSKKHRREKL